MYICKYCGKECKNDNSLRNHERLCPKNENRVYKNGMLGKKGSNQYIKAKELGLDTPEVSLETRQKLSKLATENNLKRTDEVLNKISNTITNKIKEGTWHNSTGKYYYYKDIKFDSIWEVKYAEYCDNNSIKWERCVESFDYIFENKQKKYIPDFYLPETKEYVEIKGYVRKKDKHKWNCFPSDKVLKILFKTDLKNLGIIL
jgi:hypothetical protein